MSLRYATPLTELKDASGGTKLKSYLETHSTTQAELSRMTGLSTRTIRAIVSGKREGNLATWRAIARSLHCTVDEILD